MTIFGIPASFYIATGMIVIPTLVCKIIEWIPKKPVRKVRKATRRQKQARDLLGRYAKEQEVQLKNILKPTRYIAIKEGTRVINYVQI